MGDCLQILESDYFKLQNSESFEAAAQGKEVSAISGSARAFSLFILKIYR
jgi:hypothetical protein